ncbi:hypothetical protein NDU88_007155 [Pleurodeles waltl]|uniref:Uncharacterized protein n=1 Tax=Pleurodeles waltl TaxID=8319 RepID=A0AAV7RR11_PLEWA|nr:hypothetical protein NDU88_007155 [Pleurodeles waltl]
MCSASLPFLLEGNGCFGFTDANLGKLQARIHKTVRIFFYYRRVAFGIYCNNASVLWRAKKWEYSKDDLTLYDNTEKQPNPVSLETIYQSIMEHQEESKSESHRTQLACRKMQIQIHRVAKTCSEFSTRMEEVETRISHLEDEAGFQQVTREVMEKQLEDTQWKLTDLEDRLRRNNLRVLGIPEGVEGSDTHSFMVALFKEAFPDLQQ